MYTLAEATSMAGKFHAHATFRKTCFFKVALWRLFPPAPSASLIPEQNGLLTVTEYARCNVLFPEQPARGAFLTKQLLPKLQIPCSLLCSRTVQKSNARSRAEATLTE